MAKTKNYKTIANVHVHKKTKSINTLAEQLGVLPKNINLTISEERLKQLLDKESVFWLEEQGKPLLQIGVCIGTCVKRNIIGC